MLKIDKKYFPTILIIFGSFLEIYYYYYRFSQDGIPWWLSIIIGASLNLLLAISVMQRKNKFTWALMAALFAYSVLATSAGQSFSLGVKSQNESKQIAKEKNIDIRIQEYRQLKSEYQTEKKSINDKLNGIGLWSRKNNYIEEVKILEDRRNFLDNKIIELDNKIENLFSDISINQDVEIKETNIYKFYEKLTKISNEIIQFLFHTLLSVFIALMVPIGILSIGKEKKYIKIKVKTDYIDQWVRISWVGVRSGRTQKILPKDTFLKFMESKKENFPVKKYDELKKIAKKLNIIDNDDIIINKDEIEVVKKIKAEV